MTIQAKLFASCPIKVYSHTDGDFTVFIKDPTKQFCVQVLRVNVAVFNRQVFCEVEVKRMRLSQANADLAEAAEKLEAIRKKLAVRAIIS